MLSSALIGLREGLEAALVVSILVAFLVRTERRESLQWVRVGVGVALAMSVTAGWVLTYTNSRLTFEQQEIFGGAMSLVAVAFVTGMIFWMRATARTIAGHLRDRLDEALRIGPVAVAVVAFLAVGREGLETAVFFYSAVQAAQDGPTEPLVGFLVGIAVAVALGWLIYRGAITFDLTRFFTVTGVLLVFVAAGVLGYGLHDLQEGRVLPGLTTLAFDLSASMPEDSWYGALLKGFFNYSAQTTVLQAIAWVAYVAVVLTLFLWPRRTPPVPAGQPAPLLEESS